MTRGVLLAIGGLLIAATGYATSDEKPDEPIPTPTETVTATVTPSPSPAETDGTDPSELITVSPTPTAVEATKPPEQPPSGPATLYVADHTAPGHWPVEGAVTNWNRNGRVTLVRVPSCPLLADCVDIVVAWGSLEDHPAWTETVLPGQRWQIVLNKAQIPHGRPVELRHFKRALVCHELGHVLLGTPNHFEQGHGCMDVDVDESRRYAGGILLRAVAAGVPPAPDIG